MPHSVRVWLFVGRRFETGCMETGRLATRPTMDSVPFLFAFVAE